MNIYHTFTIHLPYIYDTFTIHLARYQEPHRHPLTKECHPKGWGLRVVIQISGLKGPHWGPPFGATPLKFVNQWSGDQKHQRMARQKRTWAKTPLSFSVETSHGSRVLDVRDVSGISKGNNKRKHMETVMEMRPNTKRLSINTFVNLREKWSELMCSLSSPWYTFSLG